MILLLPAGEEGASAKRSKVSIKKQMKRIQGRPDVNSSSGL